MNSLGNETEKVFSMQFKILGNIDNYMCAYVHVAGNFCF